MVKLNFLDFVEVFEFSILSDHPLLLQYNPVQLVYNMRFIAYDAVGQSHHMLAQVHFVGVLDADVELQLRTS